MAQAKRINPIAALEAISAAANFLVGTDALLNIRERTKRKRSNPPSGISQKAWEFGELLNHSQREAGDTLLKLADKQTPQTLAQAHIVATQWRIKDIIAAALRKKGYYTDGTGGLYKITRNPDILATDAEAIAQRDFGQHLHAAQISAQRGDVDQFTQSLFQAAQDAQVISDHYREGTDNNEIWEGTAAALKDIAENTTALTVAGNPRFRVSGKVAGREAETFVNALTRSGALRKGSRALKSELRTAPAFTVEANPRPHILNGTVSLTSFRYWTLPPANRWQDGKHHYMFIRGNKRDALGDYIDSGYKQIVFTDGTHNKTQPLALDASVRKEEQRKRQNPSEAMPAANRRFLQMFHGRVKNTAQDLPVSVHSKLAGKTSNILGNAPAVRMVNSAKGSCARPLHACPRCSVQFNPRSSYLLANNSGQIFDLAGVGIAAAGRKLRQVVKQRNPDAAAAPIIDLGEVDAFIYQTEEKHTEGERPKVEYHHLLAEDTGDPADRPHLMLDEHGMLFLTQTGAQWTDSAGVHN